MITENAASAHALRSLRLLLEAYASVELPQWDLFASNVRLIRIDAGATLFAAGELHPYMYFVQSGLFKAQLRLTDGRVATVFFPEEGDVIAPLSAMGAEGIRRVVARGLHPRSDTLRAVVDQQSLHTVTAIETSLVMRVSFRVIDHLSSQHPQWSRLIAMLSLMHATTLQYDIGWLRGTPEQRYRALLAEQPGLVQRVTQRDLASFLGVTDVALSRIAKRVRSDDHSANSPNSPATP
jgi:cAMP-binding proteins - catabolite gene activator and regulatory subunit of cAMP-dependent protein kinases